MFTDYTNFNMNYFINVDSACDNLIITTYF